MFIPMVYSFFHYKLLERRRVVRVTTTADPKYWTTHAWVFAKVDYQFTIIVVPVAPGVGSAPRDHFLGRSGGPSQRTLPSGAVTLISRNSHHLVLAANRDRSFLAEVVRAVEELMAVELDADALPSQGNLLFCTTRPGRIVAEIDWISEFPPFFLTSGYRLFIALECRTSTALSPPNISA